MPSSSRAGNRLFPLLLAALFPLLAGAQSPFVPLEQQYAIAGELPGDQVYPAVAFGANGGYVVWQDNRTDGNNTLGVSARRLNGTLSGELGAFRINETLAGDQEKPQVAVLSEGGAVFVWQGGRPGFQDIYARFLSAEGTFLTGEILVNTTTNNNQISPGVAVLANGNVVVVWTSFGSGINMQDIFAQRFTAQGQKIGGEIRLNSYTTQNQRTPAIAALDNGNFAAAWLTEYVSDLSGSGFETTNNPVSVSTIIYARIFNSSATPLSSSDIRVSLTNSPACANPALAPLPGGGFTVAWSQKDQRVRTNSWDIFARSFNGAGTPNGAPVLVNSFTYGDQYAPRLATVGSRQMAIWTSLGQDGSREGVFGRFLSGGAPSGEELLVNTEYTISMQMQPALASDALNRFLVVWTSFVGGAASFDLYAQRYAGTAVLNNAPGAPYLAALGPETLHVTWPELAGYLSLDHYELFMDGNPTPKAITANYYLATGLQPASTHTFALAYRFKDGTLSELSPTVTATTWGADANGDGLPDNWQQLYWGPNRWQWAPPNADSDYDGANNLAEFLAGTHPLDAGSVLRARLNFSKFGRTLSWNSQPGSIYQVQKTVNFQGWADYGSARFAPGTTDSIPVGGVSANEFFRVIRVR